MSITSPDLKDQTSHPKIYFKDNFTSFSLPKYTFEALLQPLRKRSSEYHFHKIELFFIFPPHKSIETSYDPESSINRFIWCFYISLTPKKKSSNDLPLFFRDKKVRGQENEENFDFWRLNIWRILRPQKKNLFWNHHGEFFCLEKMVEGHLRIFSLV